MNAGTQSRDTVAQARATLARASGLLVRRVAQRDDTLGLALFVLVYEQRREWTWGAWVDALRELDASEQTVGEWLETAVPQ